MNLIKKYFSSLGFIIMIILGLIILTVFNYFNLINDNIIKYFKILIPIIASISGGIYIGTKSLNNGYVEGLKVGLTFITILGLISYLGLEKFINIKMLLYYFILLISSMFGSMIGINKHHKKGLKS
ncbi:MAG: TIGR04086 family membrane protein [Bacilli bacterium]